MGDCRGRRKTSENIGKQWKTAGDDGGRRGSRRSSDALLRLTNVNPRDGRNFITERTGRICSSRSYSMSVSKIREGWVVVSGQWAYLLGPLGHAWALGQSAWRRGTSASRAFVSRLRKEGTVLNTRSGRGLLTKLGLYPIECGFEESKMCKLISGCRFFHYKYLWIQC